MKVRHNHGTRGEMFSAVCLACEAESDQHFEEEIPSTKRVPYSWRDEDQKKELALLDAIIAECQGDILF